MLLVRIVGVVFALALPASLLHAERRGEAHLLPVGPMYDISGPLGKIYSQTCERIIFPESNWFIRYYSASESNTTGVALTKGSDGRYRVFIRQARPELSSIVWHAFDTNLDLKAELAEVKVEAGECEIPATVAEALRRHWIWLLRGVKPEDKPPRRDLFGATVILYAKPISGKMLAGKMPLEFFKYEKLATVDSIIEDLMRVCDAPKVRRNDIFANVLRKASPKEEE